MINNAPSHSDEVLSLVRVFDSLPERVFAAWTEPQLLKQWWGPPGSVVKLAEIDLRVGGRYRLGIQQAENMLNFVGGTYQEIQPPSRLVFTWRWENPEMDIGNSLVIVEFEARGNKTELQLTHSLLPTEESRVNHNEGWVGILDQLKRYLHNSTV